MSDPVPGSIRPLVAPPLVRAWWQRRRGLVAYLLIVLMTAYGFYAQDQNTHADQVRSEQSQIDSQYVSCLRFNDTRTLLRDVVVDAYSTGTPLNITKLSTFRNLDPATRDFFIQLGTLQSTRRQGAPESILARLATRDCGREFPDHSPGIELPVVTTTTTTP